MKTDIHFNNQLSHDVESRGFLYLRGNLYLDGCHHGHIRKAPSCHDEITVYITENGKINGSVEADIVIVEGAIKGNVCANKLFIYGTLEGIACYCERLEVHGQTMQARIIRMSDLTKLKRTTHLTQPLISQLNSINTKN